MKVNKRFFDFLKTLTWWDWVQVALNFFAFALYLLASGGHGSFWGFATFTLMSLINLIENVLSKDKRTMVIWGVKVITYSILCVLMWTNKGEFKIFYLIMILISGISLLISKRVRKERFIAMWGSNIAYLIAAILYIIALLQNPQQFGTFHILFWSVNFLSYVLLIVEILIKRDDRVKLIIPIFALCACLVYIVVILLT